MSALPQKPVAGPRRTLQLLERHNPRETFKILARRIILANERIRDPVPRSRTRVQTESQKLMLTAKDLKDIQTGRYGGFQLPSEEEARYWLRQWRDGIKRSQDPVPIKNPGARKRPEVRE